MVYLRRQKAEFLRTMTLLQAIVNSGDKHLESLLDDYKKAAFPLIDGGKSQQTQQAKRAMEMFSKQGPLVIGAESVPVPSRVQGAMARTIKK